MGDSGRLKRPCPTRCPRSRCGRSATRASRRCTTATTPRRAAGKACSIDICDYQDAAKRSAPCRCACDDGWKGKVCRRRKKRRFEKAFVALVMLLTALTLVSVCLSVYASRSQRRVANYERILAEGRPDGRRSASKRPCPTRARSRCGRSATRASRRCTTATTPRRACRRKLVGGPPGVHHEHTSRPLPNDARFRDEWATSARFVGQRALQPYTPK